MQKNKAVVSVHGKEYTVVSTDAPEYMQRVAGYVDRRMNELAMATYLPEQRLYALTALNLADELLKSKDENNALRKELTQLRVALQNAQKKEKPE